MEKQPDTDGGQQPPPEEPPRHPQPGDQESSTPDDLVSLYDDPELDSPAG
jgi:hypothetical protein